MNKTLLPILVAAFMLPATAGAQEVSSAGNARDAAVAKAAMEAERASMKLRDAQGAVDARRDKLSETSGLISATPDTVRQLAERLQSERETLELEEAAAKGREAAITEAIAKTTERLRTRADVDEVIKQLDAVVAVRQAQLDRVRQLQNNGAAPRAEVESAEAGLATARADVALAKQKTSGASTDLLEALNRELINLAITRQERLSRLQYIQSRLKTLTPALAQTRDLEMAMHDFQRAQRDADAALDRLGAAQRAGN